MTDSNDHDHLGVVLSAVATAFLLALLLLGAFDDIKSCNDRGLAHINGLENVCVIPPPTLTTTTTTTTITEPLR